MKVVRAIEEVSLVIVDNANIYIEVAWPASWSPHPSWIGHSIYFATREVVYYILLGTPRSPQKCFWSGLRVEFSGENHLLLICGKIPNQTFWITKYLDSGLNSDLFKKKICPNRTCLDCFRYQFFVIFWKWEPLLDSYNFEISGQILTKKKFK